MTADEGKARFAAALTGDCARLEADVVSYSFIVSDLHRQLVAGRTAKDPGHYLAISMDGKGAWRDNVFIERLWRSVKYEEVYLRAYDSVSTPQRISTRPRGAEASTMWSTIYANRCHFPNYAARCKMGERHRLSDNGTTSQIGRPSPSITTPRIICLRSGPVILGKSVCTERIAAVTTNRQAGRIHEDHGEIGEQVAPPRKQSLLDHILSCNAARPASGCDSPWGQDTIRQIKF